MQNSNRQSLESYLCRGAEQLGLSLSEGCVSGLMEYLTLLQKWNRAYNLTAVREPAAMVSLHVLDSLSIAPYLKGQRFLDVGTGAGLPGIPLALLYPGRDFTLLDSNGKKTRFLNEVCARLNLRNVTVCCQRVEAFDGGEGFDGILSRAFTTVAGMAAACGPLLNSNGRLLAMKGQFPEGELSELAKPYIVESCHRLTVPGVEAERHLLVIRADGASTQ